jgi:hypothetical protein
MSVKERDRLKVLHAVQKRHITQGQAGPPIAPLYPSVASPRPLQKTATRVGTHR